MVKNRKLSIPQWLKKISNATVKAAIAENPAVATASGWTIDNNGEARQNATDSPGVKQLQKSLAAIGAAGTAVMAAPAIGTALSNPVAQKLIGDAAASMLGGEVVDKTHRALTGQSFGRGVASVFGQQNVYDRSALARFGYDALNPGYFAGNLVSKGTNAAIDAAGKTLKNADNYITIRKALRTGKLRFGEPTTYTGIHQSKTPLTKVQFPFQRWDVTTHGADPNGFWLTIADSPNTTGTMASRPYASRWSATSQKPLIQTGEVKGLLGKKNNTRNAIVKYGRKHGADAFEFRGIADNRLPQTDVVMVTEGTNPQYLGGVGQVRYAGPTTGKSTFIKANSDSGLVDLDAIPGYKQLRKDIAEQLGLDWKSPKVTDSPEYQQAFNNFIKEWAQNTENSGKTLFGSAKGLLRGDNPLTGQPFIPDFETFVARNQARGFKENPEQLRAWYDSIIDSYPEIKIDNRFVGEIPFYNAPTTSVKSIQMEEPIMGRGPGRPKKSSAEAPISSEAWDEMLFEDLVGEQAAIKEARKASRAGKRVLKPITEAEKLGIPKSLRSDSRALEDPYYWGYEQWNQRYNDAVRAGNIEEAQRLRDLHFQIKAINNQLQVDGHPITLYHGNIGSNGQLAVAGYNPYSTTRTTVGSSGYFAVTDPQIASTYKGPKGSINAVYGYSKKPAVYDAEGRNWQNAIIKEVDGHRVGVKTDTVVNSAFDSGHDAALINNVVDYGFYTPASHPRQPFTDYVFKPGNVKLKDAVVEDGLFFEPIPIVKRDNFHNPDIRYGLIPIVGGLGLGATQIPQNKKGGIVSAQKGKIIKYPTSTTGAFLSGTMDYLLRRDNPKSFIKSEYKPTVGDNGETYYTRDGLKNEVALSLFGGTDSNKQFLGQNYFYKDFDDAYNQLSVHNDSRHTSNGTLGNYAASAGQDDRGRYLSFSDKFDFVLLPGKPIHIYDRIYEDEVDQLYDKNDSAVNLGDFISKAPKFKRLKENGGTLKDQKGKL